MVNWGVKAVTKEMIERDWGWKDEKRGRWKVDLKRVECLKKEERDSVKENRFFFFGRGNCFFNVKNLKKNTIDLENCEKFKTYVVSSHEVNKKLKIFDFIVLYRLTLNLMSLKLNWNKRLNLKLMTM